MRFHVTTLFTVFVCVMCCAVPNAALSDELEFPYQAIVRVETQVRSGPGGSHYATEELGPGDSVIVYRIDPGKWAAIRPTPSSFSLVPASAIELVDVENGKVIVGDTQAWVGTRLDAVEKPLWQVKLRKDEKVKILGEVHWPTPDGHSILWYQISPPAGEFRWIRLSDLQHPVTSNRENLKPDRLSAPPADIAQSGRPPNRLHALMARLVTPGTGNCR